MAEKKPKKLKLASIRNLDEADKALLRIAQAGLKRKKLAAATELRINKLKEELLEATTPLDEEINGLDEVLLEFIESHEDELFSEDKKTVEVPFGKLTCRESTKLVIKSIEKTVDALKEQGWKDAITVKETPNKEKLADYSDADLKTVGVKRVTENTLAYKVDEEKAAQVRE